MKKVLEYSKEELEQLSTEELEMLLMEANKNESLFNTRQLVEKLSINSLYGAFSNVYFPLFNQDIARAITGNGRYFIQKLANYIENKLQELHPSQKEYITYGDTDSVLGSTIIKTSAGVIKIEDLYNNLNGNVEVRNSDNFIKHITGDIKAASVSPDIKLEYNNIKYVMKHKVKKKMYKIKCGGDEVIITEDHSMMIIRDEMLIEIKPKDVLKSDKIVKISN
jgi:DNA polymerase elongation subunit (family B)